MVLAKLVAVRHRDGVQYGLPDASRISPAVFPRIHGGMGARSVPALAGGARARAALVLGHLHQGFGLLSSHGVRERLHVSRVRLVRFRGAGAARARLATSEIPALLG